MGRRGKLTPELIGKLRRGEDRNGLGRTWNEVAEYTGYSHSYVTRIWYGTTGRRRQLIVAVIDPRDYCPDLQRLMNDEDVEEWQKDPRCVCGCGVATKQEHTNAGLVPRGAYRLFVNSHQARMPSRKAAWGAFNALPATQARILASNSAKMIPSEDIREIAWAWVRSAPGRDMAQLAALAHVSIGLLRNLHRQRGVRLLSAAKILVATGQPVTREMAKEYRAWAKRAGIVEVPQILIDGQP